MVSLGEGGRRVDEPQGPPPRDTVRLVESDPAQEHRWKDEDASIAGPIV